MSVSESETNGDITPEDMELLITTTDDEGAFEGTCVLKTGVGPFAAGVKVALQIERGKFSDLSMRMTDGKEYIYLFPRWHCGGGVYNLLTNERVTDK